MLTSFSILAPPRSSAAASPPRPLNWTGRLADADELLHTCASPLLCCCLPRPPPVWSCTSSLRVIPPTLHTRRIQVPALACVEPSGGVPAVPHLPRAGRVQPLP